MDSIKIVQIIYISFTPILIVDDVSFNHIALKGLLNILNLKCDSAYNGIEGINKV
jgi:CheY-like chemotaxis protein